MKTEEIRLIREIIENINASDTGTVQAGRFVIPASRKTIASHLTNKYAEEVVERGYDPAITDAVAARINAVAGWLTDPRGKPSLLLYGSSPGTGKTTLARAVFALMTAIRGVSWQAVLDPEIRAKVFNGSFMKYDPDFISSWIPGPTFIQAEEVADNTIKGGRGYLEEIRKAKFLIIDDIGVEPPRVYEYKNEIRPLAELLDFRYLWRLPTVLTSNLPDAALSDRYGPRILDRLNEMAAKVAFSGKSFRR